jgi:hypothetical protein
MNTGGKCCKPVKWIEMGMCQVEWWSLVLAVSNQLLVQALLSCPRPVHRNLPLYQPNTSLIHYEAPRRIIFSIPQLLNFLWITIFSASIRFQTVVIYALPPQSETERI